MRRPQLDLAALRGRNGTQFHTDSIENSDGASTASISRRDLLKLTGAAAIGSAQSLSALGASWRETLECEMSDQRAVFKLAGRERWVIDPRRFGGKPRLKTFRNEQLLRLELVDARYPGTELDAGMLCEIRRHPSEWRMKLNLALGEFACEVAFEDWLAGIETARAGVSLNETACTLGGRRAMSMKGTAQADFFPNWTLNIAGHAIGRVSGFGAEIHSDRAALSLLEPSAPGLTTHTQARRTLISLKRGEGSWPFKPMPDNTQAWRIATTASTFDTLHLEAGESDEGLSAGGYALLAESNAEEPQMLFHPSSHLTDGAGERFALPLRNARYALALDTNGATHEEQAILIARFAEAPVWLHHEGVGLQLGDTDETQPFELVCRNGKLESLRCAPAVLSVAASLPDAIVDRTPATKGSRLSFNLSNAGETAPPTVQLAPERDAPPTGQLHIATSQAACHITLAHPSEPIKVIRAADLLSLTFYFKNLLLVASDGGGQGSGRILRRENPNAPAYIIVNFPPQHITEEIFPNDASSPQARLKPRALPAFLAAHFRGAQNTPLTFPVGGHLSGHSQLVFQVPDATKEVEFTLRSLLDWGRFNLVVAPNALLPEYPFPPPQGVQPVATKLLNPPPKYNPFDPENPITLIEAPTRLVLSPNEAAAWAHSLDAVTHDDRTELWHTRLGVKGADGDLESACQQGQANCPPDEVDEHNDYYRTLRAIYSCPNDSFPFPVDEFKPTALGAEDREELVQLTSDSFDKGGAARFIKAERLMLTALGAWMNVIYAADPPQGFNLEEWRHRMTMGRDHYVRVVHKGYLYPFGHRASKVTITERKFRLIPGGNQAGGAQGNQVGAFLFQRTFIIVRQPLKKYDGKTLKVEPPKPGAPPVLQVGDPSKTNLKGGETINRMMPFKSVRLTTVVTPNLLPATPLDILKIAPDGEPLLFHMVGEDIDGQFVEFTAPLVFVPATLKAADGTEKSDPKAGAFTGDAILPTAIMYAAKRPDVEQRRPMQGQRIAFAASQPGQPQGATSFETDSMTFDAFVSDSVAEPALDQPAFFPIVSESVIRVQAIEHLLGNNQKPSVRFHSAYLQNGFDGAANQGEVFFDLARESFEQAGKKKMLLDFAGQADKAGGLVTPSINIDGLSRKFGPVGDASNLAAGNFKPANFFDIGKAKILGGITLDSIIDEVFGQDTVPSLTNTVERDGSGNPLKTVTELSWNPQLKTDNKFLVPSNNGAGNLSLKARLVKPLGSSAAGNAEPPYYVSGELRDFKLSLFDLVMVNFDNLKLTVQTGKKLDLSATLKEPPVTFGGPLSFVNTLAAIIGPADFSDPPSVDVSPGGVTVGYSLSLPAIEAGAWAIRDLKLGAALTIPFTGNDATRLRLNFSERENPFQIAAYGVTGGAFLAVHIGLGGLERLEASIELGGSLALNLGVASGAVYLMIGIHMTMEIAEKNTVTLGGYVRTGGALSVLGLITVSVEFYMEMAYNFQTEVMRGEASLTVKVKVLFFSKKVRLTVVRELAAPGSPKEPPQARFLDAPSPVEAAHLSDERAWSKYCDAFA